MMRQGFRRVLIVFSVLLLAFSAVKAQDSDITLSVAIPEVMRSMIGENAFTDFEASHPGVHVHINYIDFELQFPASLSANPSGYFEDVAELVQSADVVGVTGRNLSIAATRAGYFLDLTPLTSADPTLNVDDFIPATWRSFQWEGGVWALPVSTDVITIIYDPDAFDKANLGYPNENWTLEDLANAANALAEKDADGTVTTPGLVSFDNVSLLLRALYAKDLYDSSSGTAAPQFSDPELETLLSRWAELEEEGVVSSNFSGDITQPPLRISGSFGMGGFPGAPNQTPPQSSLLPGGVAGLDVQGVAVSSGTQYPELAYELAKFLTSSLTFINNGFGAVPARRSMAGITPPSPDASETSSDGGGIMIMRPQLSPEIQAVVDNALEHGLSVAETQFSDYLSDALRHMSQDGDDAQTALQRVEVQAVADLQLAEEQRDTVQIVVTPPPPEVVLQPGEISLKFGLVSFINPMPNRERWEELMQAFADEDPQVGKVELDTGFGSAANLAERDDCFYMPYNAVPGLNLDTVLNLDPFIDADPQFDKNDLVGNALQQVQRDNKTWALPVVIQPQVLQYQSELFEQAGLSVPEGGWTLETFVDALQTLKTQLPDNKPFEPRDPAGTYLLMLIAAAGGVPFDYNTSPPTINFTDPATVNAIRQVLDLAKDDYIDYQELAKTNFAIMANIEDQPAIVSQTLNGFIMLNTSDRGENPYRTVLYPSGSQYTPLSYDIGTSYISATSQNAEACYRWIGFLAQHPELFNAMPARYSLLSDPAFASTEGADKIAVYQQIAELMQQPNTVYFPTPFSGDGGSPQNFILQFWLNRAFDRYVSEAADLEAELGEAQTFAKAFLDCVAQLPPVDPASDQRGAFFEQYNQCATTVDPTLESIFPSAASS